MESIKIKKLVSNAVVPEYMTVGSAGMDLTYSGYESITMYKNNIEIVECGFAMELPPGYEAQIRPRSSMACRKGITVVNSPGTIDSDYRGEIMVALINIGPHNFYTINPGDRIAQMVIAKYEQPKIEIVDSLSETVRGEGRFGSTNK